MTSPAKTLYCLGVLLLSLLPPSVSVLHADADFRPTRSTIQVAALGRPGMYVEIEASAAAAP